MYSTLINPGLKMSEGPAQTASSTEDITVTAAEREGVCTIFLLHFSIYWINLIF